MKKIMTIMAALAVFSAAAFAETIWSVDAAKNKPAESTTITDNFELDAMVTLTSQSALDVPGKPAEWNGATYSGTVNMSSDAGNGKKKSMIVNVPAGAKKLSVLCKCGSSSKASNITVASVEDKKVIKSMDLTDTAWKAHLEGLDISAYAGKQIVIYNGLGAGMGKLSVKALSFE